MNVAPLQFLLLVLVGWANRRQLEVLDDLKEENRVLREQLRGRRLRFTDEHGGAWPGRARSWADVRWMKSPGA